MKKFSALNRICSASRPCVLGLAIMSASLWPSFSHASNSNYYPPAPQAKSAIDLDGKGFIVNGQRTLVLSGSIHYPRVPNELWHDRLLRLKRADFNTVQSYIFWNFSERKENQFDFRGDADIAKFLSTAQGLGLYAIMRPGPYVCAEWDSGGFPVWLKFKEGVVVRSNNPAFLALSDHWYDKIIPMIAEHQINRGGNVILVQLENEHHRGWGVLESPNDIDVKRSPRDIPLTNLVDKASYVSYFKHLHEKAVADGLEVPHFLSGQHHGFSPTPKNIDPSKARFPWFSTEFWAGWFDIYGKMPEKVLIRIDQAQWAILAQGGGGYNFYMLHGGSNFESWNDNSTAASYDYATAIGQGGDLRPVYYRMKRVNQLGKSFPAILANSSDDMNSCREFASGPAIQVLGARKSDAGTLVFIRNTNSTAGTATLKTGDTLKVSAYGTYPIPQNLVLNQSAKLTEATLPILGLARNGHVVTAIVYGHSGETGRVTLSGTEKFVPGISSPAINVSAQADNRMELRIKIPQQGVEECQLDQTTHSVRIVAINQDLSLYTWILGETGSQYAVFGPAFVQDLRKTGETMSAVIERPYRWPSCGQVAVYGDKSKSWHLGVKADTSLDSQPAPKLSAWQMVTTKELLPDYDDSKWLQSEDPQQMGVDGDYGCFAWYRAVVDLPGGGDGTLHLKGTGDIRVFINGSYVKGDKNIKDVNASFVPGKNKIAVLVAHNGRDKMGGYVGPVANRDNKGLHGPAWLELSGQRYEVKGWRMRGGLGGNPEHITSWGGLGETHGQPAFYRATFTAKPPSELGAYPILRVKSAGLGRGTMWVNGHNLGQYPERIAIDGLYIPECWLNKDAKNELAIFETHGNDPTQVQLEIETAASREVIRVSQTIDPATPMVVPPEGY